MPARLSKPTNVPDGHQPLIDMLWRFYVAADGPATRRIAQAISELGEDERKGTANHETVRRVLTADYLPQWQTVEVIFLALCEIADVDPDDENNDDEYGYGNQQDAMPTHRDSLQRCYRLARYGTLEEPPRTRTQKAQQETAERERRRTAAAATSADPWGSAPTASAGGFAEEPPF